MNESRSASTAPASRPDPEAWLDEHGDALYGYALARVRDRAVAEDLVQDTLLAAFRSLDSYAHASTERTWLIGILRHKLLDHLRQTGRERQLWDEEAPADEAADDFDERGRWKVPPAAWSAPEQALDQDEFWRAFTACVDALPEKLRTPFLLRELEGLETHNLTAVLSVTKSNLWAMLSRARALLRHCLTRHWFTP